MKLILTFFLLLLLSISCKSQCNSELKNYSTAFKNIEAKSFSFLDNSLKDVQIVGYGEDTHGTAEFTILAGELMKYLSEKHDFKLFILETGFGEGQYLNDYIQGKNDDLQFIMNERNQTWRYRTKEFYEVMNSLKEYNKNNDDKIYIYGCEMQYIHTDINRIKEYLIKVNSDYKIDGFKKPNLWMNFDENEKVDYYISYTKLKKYFIENYENFKTKTSEKEFQIAYHQLEIIGQFVTSINQSNLQRKHDFREIFMLENIQWILNYEKEDRKLFFWAQNDHIGNTIINGTSNSIGRLLKNGFGDHYFSIATDFGTGSFLAYPANANETGNWRHQIFTVDKVMENTFTNCLKKIGKPNTFLNIRKARSIDNLKLFFDKPLTQMSGAGAQIRHYKTETRYTGIEFDAIIYLDNTREITWK